MAELSLVAAGSASGSATTRSAPLYRSERLHIDECDWATLDLNAIRRPALARTMIVFDEGRVLLGAFENAHLHNPPFGLCTMFRFFTADDHGDLRSLRPIVQLTAGVLFHFYRRRQVLRMRLPAPALHAEEDSFALLRFAQSARALPANPGEWRGAAYRKQPCLVERAQALMLTSIGARHTLGEVARKLHVSPFHLSHVFRREVGASVHQYLLQMRVVTALDRLRQGPTDLSKLALELGFSHHSHFSATFRRMVGNSPSEVRRMLTGQTSEGLSTYRCPDVTRGT